MSQTNKEQAFAVATEFMGVAPELSDLNKDAYWKNSHGFSIEYVSYYDEWVTWSPGQLEGRNRGGHDRFISWANNADGYWKFLKHIRQKETNENN